MNPKKAEVILHPVRMRIIQTLLSCEKLTVQQLIEKLEDVPQATMYRQLKILLQAETIEIVETNKIRGTVEKVYAVSKEQLTISDEEVEQTKPEEHLRYFMVYQANLLKEFEHYVLNQSPKNYKEDGLGFWQTIVHLSDEEFVQFSREYKELIEKVVKNKPHSSRKPRMLASIFIPK